mmetsp:Transcript_18795/g.16732  ORF Transcript_18795/g.16732 Transcript_18795/m.16732 type:complete len:81 (+) Transcript_18795:112-354(+)
MMYETDPSQSTGFDPVVLLLIPIGIILCLMCACMAFMCGAGIGYIIRCCIKGENTQRTQTKHGPNYQQVAIESEREQQAV